MRFSLKNVTLLLIQFVMLLSASQMTFYVLFVYQMKRKQLYYSNDASNIFFV